MNTLNILCWFQFKGICLCRQIKNIKDSLHTCTELAGLYQQGLNANYQQYRLVLVPELIPNNKIQEKAGTRVFQGRQGEYLHVLIPRSHAASICSSFSTSCLKGLQLCQIFRPTPEVIPKFKPPNPSVIYINASLIQLNVPCVLLILSKNLYSYLSRELVSGS